MIAHCITKWTVAQDELGCNHSSCYVESFTSDEACQHFMHWPPAAAYLSVGVGQTLTMVSRESSSVGAERGWAGVVSFLSEPAAASVNPCRSDLRLQCHPSSPPPPSLRVYISRSFAAFSQSGDFLDGDYTSTFPHTTPFQWTKPPGHGHRPGD